MIALLIWLLLAAWGFTVFIAWHLHIDLKLKKALAHEARRERDYWFRAYWEIKSAWTDANTNRVLRAKEYPQ